MPKQRGSATRNTTIPAIRSCLGYENIESRVIGYR
jgi:hypothetical protein